METIKIPADAKAIVSTSSKGDQSKWRIHNKWIKQNTRGYENLAEYAATLLLKSSILHPSQYVAYTPCLIEQTNGHISEGCYFVDQSRKSLLNVYLKGILQQLIPL